MPWKHQEHFSAGEIAPQMFGRIDLNRYEAGARRLQDAILDTYGTPFRRYGTQYRATSAGKAKLVLWRIEDEVLVIELTNGILNVLDVNAQPVAGATGIVTPWADTEFDKLWVSNASVGRMYFCHPDFEPRVLRRSDDGSNYTFSVQRFNDQDPVLDPRIKTQLLSTVTGSPPTLESTNFFFIGDDQNAYWRIQSGWLFVDNFVSNNVLAFIQMDLPVPLDVSTIEWAGPWVESANGVVEGGVDVIIGGGPGDVVTIEFPSGHGLGNGAIGEVLDFDIANGLNKGQKVGWIYGIPGPTTIRVRLFRGTVIAGNTFEDLLVYTIKDRDSIDNSIISFQGDPAQGQVVIVSCTQPVFGPEMIAGPGDDRNAVLTFNDGQVRVSLYVDPNQVNGIVKSTLGHEEPATVWGQGWSPHTGFPTCVTEHQSRVFYAGFKKFPNLMIASKTNKPNNFRLGGLDDDALNFSVSSDRNNLITWMQSAGDLLVGTEENEFVVRGQPVTPSQVGIDLQHSFGGAVVVPQNVGAATLFVTRCGCSIREMVFRFERDQYLAPEITILSRHLFADSPIVELEYIRDPDPLVFARLQDGSTRCLTYRRDDETGVVGWSPWTAKANSMARVPRAGVEEIWFSVERVIDGQTVHYIEALVPGAVLDSQISSVATGAAQISGLGTLEGEVAQVRTESGLYLGERAVLFGVISNIPLPPGTPVFVGLGFQFILSPQVLEPPDQRGEGPGRRRRINHARIQVDQSVGGTVEGKAITGLEIETFPTSQIPLVPFTGWVQRPALGEVGEAPTFEIVHDIPFPFHVLSVAIGDEQIDA